MSSTHGALFAAARADQPEKADHRSEFRAGDAQAARPPAAGTSALARCRGQAVLCLLLGWVALGCGAQTERPAPAPAPAPPAKTGRGYSYRNDRVAEVPWSIHIVQIDRGREDYELVATLGQDRVLGLDTLTSQIKTIPRELGHPLAAINGDYYRTEGEPYSGDPRGLHILRGELVSAPVGNVCFWVELDGQLRMAAVSSAFQLTWPNGETSSFGLNEELRSSPAVLYTPMLGSSTRTPPGREFILEQDGTNSWLPLTVGENYTARVRDIRESGDTALAPNIMILAVGRALAARTAGVTKGAVLRLSTATQPALKGLRTALGGGPLLVENGTALKPVTNKAMERHPRSALGWNQQHLFFVEVDGRQRNLSVGMTLPELAEYLAKLGCQYAMNLDGGGSSEVWVNGQVMNSPCYGHERPTATGLVLLQKEPKQTVPAH